MLAQSTQMRRKSALLRCALFRAIMRATPRRTAVNRPGVERYALAFFCDGNIDWPVAAVPTCVGPDKPPKYPTTYYTDYMISKGTGHRRRCEPRRDRG